MQGFDNNGQPRCVAVMRQDFSAGCPAGQMLQGFSNGAAQCVPVSLGCPSGQVLQGIANGAPQCAPVVPTTFSAGCPGGQVLQGFSGGAPVCVSGSMLLAQGTGCGACPYGSYWSGQGAYCTVRDRSGSVLQAGASSGQTCQVGNTSTGFSFWTY